MSDMAVLVDDQKKISKGKDGFEIGEQEIS